MANHSIHISCKLSDGLRYHQAGELKAAEKVYKRILKDHPFNPDCLHLLGVIANQTKNYSAAVDLISRAVAINPGKPVYYNNLGNAYRDNGSFDNAVLCYKKALKIKPDFCEIHVNLGNTFIKKGQIDDAVCCYKKALEINPESADAYYNLGNACREIGKINDAISCYRKALQIHPVLADAYYNLGNMFREIGKIGDAISCYEKTLEKKPDFAEAYNNIGNLYQEQNKFESAGLFYQNALKIKPGYYQAWNNLGNTLRSRRLTYQSIFCYQKALELNGDYAEAFLNMGISFHDMEKFHEAIACYDNVLKLDQTCPEAFNFKGIALKSLGRHDESVQYFQKAIELKPGYAEACSYLVHQLQQTCDWKGFSFFSSMLDDFTNQAIMLGKKIYEPPFINITRNDNLQQNFIVAQQWCADISKCSESFEAFLFDDRKHFKKKIIIGYLSNDFRDHATSHLMLSMFGLHDRNRFKVYCYSSGTDDKSRFRERIKMDSDRFVDIRNFSDIEAAQRIFKDRVDILVDLNGHTRGGRLGICSFRPAPVQASYLGFPGTTGADFIDYIITDRIVTSEAHASFYSEKFLFLPHSYQVNDNTQLIAKGSLTKKDFGLPEKGFIFSSFNQTYKIEPLIFNTWMNILARVPDSVLWLFTGGQASEKNLREEAKLRMINPNRLIFAEKTPKEKHLARLGLADLALDTRIVNGHTTTSDALWAGVPVVAMKGRHFASRVSASLLTAVGLPELIADNLNDYEALAVQLAENPGMLEAIRDKLTKNRNTMPLFDTPGFARDLEKGYFSIWDLFLSGRNPQHIAGV
jgi:protein O-GlcNAc transferase